MSYLIDSILPAEEIHLLAGPSGAGKTRWLFHTLLTEWSQGLPVLGYASNPCPWVYVASDRTQASVDRTLTSMGFQPGQIPIIPAWDQCLTINGIFDKVFNSGAKLAVIESFGSFVEPPANSSSVKQFLAAVSVIARRSGITIIGVVESPKMKPYERYENPRQRVSGAASWGHFSETIFLIEPANVSKPGATERKLFVCPRNAPGIEKDGAFTPNGHLKFF